MCGIIGVIDTQDDVSLKLFLGLVALQHRGQDACGIATCNGTEVFAQKHNKLVLNSFTEPDLLVLKGRMGIAHTRYATIGPASLDNVQPLVDEVTGIAIAFNGNITNYFDLKERLEKKGVMLKTTSDAEVILYYFLDEYKRSKDVFLASQAILDNLEGAYSIIGFIPEKGLFGIRDRNAIRPMVLGKYKNSQGLDCFVLASESVAIQTMDMELVRDLAPAEILFISLMDNILTSNIAAGDEASSRAVDSQKTAHCMFEWVYFARPESLIEERSVYKARLALGVLLAERLKQEGTVARHNIDVVIPVPDTARSCAIKLSEELGLKHREGLIKNRYIGRTFIMPSQESRVSSVHIKLNPIISIVKDKNVMLVDDSIVRGTTSKRIIKLLRDAGAKKIVFVSSCPPIKHPCFYGIDMSTDIELIASNKSIEEIREYIGADELIYSTTDDLRRAIRRDLCTACLDGVYPVDIPENCRNCFVKDKEFR